ncbi:MAG: PKD domain-containing protein, partial [Halobacteriota archaeon]
VLRAQPVIAPPPIGGGAPTITSTTVYPNPVPLGSEVYLTAQIDNPSAWQLQDFQWRITTPSGDRTIPGNLQYGGAVFTPTVDGAYSVIATLYYWNPDTGLLEHVDSAPTTLSVFPLPQIASVTATPDPVSLGDPVTLEAQVSNLHIMTAITYRWTIQPPSGSSFTIGQPWENRVSFTPAEVGTYHVVVDVWGDGQIPARFTFSDTKAINFDVVTPPQPNQPPVADAGQPQSVHIGTLATLDGSKSNDADGTVQKYAWTIASAPDGSTAALSDPIAVKPTFTPDKVGTYTFSLKVTDDKGAESTNDAKVTITATNDPPTANAGPDQTSVLVKSTIKLDGSQSTDPNNDPIASYAWTLTTPKGSKAQLSGATTATPTLIPDKAGTYTIQLVVTDKYGAQSTADTMTVTAVNKLPKPPK